MWQDLINALLELIAVITACFSIHCLYVDKCLKGKHIIAVLYSAVFSTWFIYYYAHLNQWYSFACAFAYWVAVAVWTVMGLYYKRAGEK